MKSLQDRIDLIRGKPLVVREDGHAMLIATHRRTASGEVEPRLMRILGFFGALAILVNFYGPDTLHDENSNFILVLMEYVTVGLLNAGECLSAVAEAQSLDIPLESLRGWLFAALWFCGAWVIRHSFLMDVIAWLGNRETVRVRIDDDELSVRPDFFSLRKQVKRGAVRSVEIIAERPCGHEVVVLHDDGVLKVASIFGDKSRALLFTMRLRDLLEGRTAPVTTFERLPEGAPPARLMH